MPLLAALLLFATPDDAEIAKGLRNLAQMHAMGATLEIRQLAKIERAPDFPNDAWGTPYRIEGMRIVSAGSDRKFEEEPLPNEQFSGTEGDTVFAGGAMYRSNRIWLAERAKEGDAAAALGELRTAELRLMMLRNPAMRNLLQARMTVELMQRGAPNDAWGNPLRAEGTRVVSAGADGVFDPMSWDRPPKLDAGEDIIVDNGAVVRRIDERQFLEEHYPTAVPVPQPPHPALVPEEGKRYRVGGEVRPPRVTHRVEPHYDESYRRARIEGIVILESKISDTGELQEVRLRKSCAPELDAAAIEALRQWKFAPGTRNGKPVDVIFLLTINFKLK